ncbi:hypothetical protein AGMMS49940_16010 [Spirochaetia bacterium]|nr:hypothetical protein AGMMS49940_16010 [Spirochaetia bacterium]
MKVLVIGSGGREHAIAWKLAQSEKVVKVYVAPGNGGTAIEAACENAPASLGDPATEAGQDALIGFVQREGIALTVVGPEVPLALGIVDRFRASIAVPPFPGATYTFTTFSDWANFHAMACSRN